MKRVRWLGAQWPITMRQLAQRLRADALTPEGSSGFVITRVRDQQIEAKFVEKWLTEDVVTDPFGTTVTYERVLFKEPRFTFAAAFPQVELVDPPRSINSLASRLLQIMDFKLGWNPLKVDVLRWADNIQGLTKSPITVQQIRLKGMMLDEFTGLDAVITGTRDVKLITEKFLRGRSHQIEKIQISFLANRRDLRIQLSADGSIQSPDYTSAESVALIKEAIPPPET